MSPFFKLFSFVCFCAVFFFNFSLKVFAQTNYDKNSKNVIYIEGAGAGGYGSINYERLCFSSSKTAFAFRLGVSTYYLNDYTDTFNPEIILPVALHFLYGKNHKLEVGAGQTITSFVRASRQDFQPKRDVRNHTHFMLGYRYQKNKGGFMVRVAYTPILEFNTDYQHWGGLAVGYSF
ncbi:hypothetical protein WAF17_18990 [Bernardetia sp. ABR2-2B]|uniref:hypothetical protein n=1 Tax=Bernardetia sp. ABR2-2B TaxID=3127472 RepID=UPI0030D168DC